MRGQVGAADAAADLVELREAERVGALDDQRVGLRDVDARLDDGRRDEHVGVSAKERVHLLLELALAHLSVRDEEAQFGRELLQLLRDLLDRLDAVVQIERLSAALVLPLERRLHDLLVVLADGGADRPAALRRRLDDRDVAQAGQRHVQRPRNRRRRKREDVDLEPERAQQLFLRDAEALLLVEDDEAEVLGDDVARQHAMRSDQNVDLAFGEVSERLLLLCCGSEPRDHLHAHGEVAVALAERVPVLLGEDRRRREHHHLLVVHRRGEGCADGNLRLAEADVAADEPIHRTRRLEVLLHVLDRALLIGRLPVRERRFELLEPLVSEVVRIARRLLPLRVEREQLARELADRRARARLEVLPRLAAELRERGRRCVGADVSRDLADLLVRDVEAVVTAKREQQVVARDAGDCLRLEAEQLADAVVLVHDVVAGAQVGERLKRAPDARGLRPACALAEELRVGQEDEVQVAPDEAAARRRDGESRLRLLGQRFAALEQRRVDAAQQVLGAQRIAAVRKRDDRRGGRRARTRSARSRPPIVRARREPDAAPRTRTAGRRAAGRASSRRSGRSAEGPPPPRPASPVPAPRRGRGRPAATGTRSPGTVGSSSCRSIRRSAAA